MIRGILCENNGSLSIIMNNLTVSGKATYEIIQTNHGKGLKINGNDNVLIESKGNEDVPNAKLNMLDDSDNDGSVADEYDYVNYWIYVNSTNISKIKSIEVRSIIDHSSSRYGGIEIYCFFKINKIENSGWFKVEGISEEVAMDSGG